MNYSRNLMKMKKRSKKGFTLMEMLIVVAIIAILVAIAIPVFSAQLENAREQVDEANLRSATSMAVADYLSNSESEERTYVGLKADSSGDNHTLIVSTSGTDYYESQSSINKDKHIEIVIKDGDVTKAGWTDN